MGGFGEMKVWCLVVMIVMAAAAAPHAEAAISCGQVLSSVSPCLSFLQRGGGVPPPCCDAIKSLSRAAATTPDRQAVCGCVKNLAPRIGANTNNINTLIAQCASNLPYRYSPSIDCSKVKY